MPARHPSRPVHAVAVTAFTLLVGSTALSSAQAAPAPCPDVEAVFARGTFAPQGLGDTGEDFEEVYDEYSDESVVVDWAELFFQRLPEPRVDRFPVGIEIPLATDPDVVNHWDTYGAVRFLSSDAVALTMPWGEEMRVSLPVADSITSHGFTAVVPTIH